VIIISIIIATKAEIHKAKQSQTENDRKKQKLNEWMSLDFYSRSRLGP
jgi:hypothetical protein